MKFEARNWYHIYNQGNNRESIFFEKENYLFFLSKLQKLPNDDFNIVAYCLMPNHFHLLIYSNIENEEEIEKGKLYSRKIGSTLSSYTKAINKRYHRSGSLFRQKTKAKCLTKKEQTDEQYMRTCFHYIHQNPLKAQLVNRLEDWLYSSFRDYAGYRNGTLPDVQKGKEMLEFKSNKAFIQESKQAIDPQRIENIF